MGLPARKDDKHYTYGDYRAWPDDERWELVDGVAYNMSPAPMTEHFRLSHQLLRILDGYFDDKPCQVFYAPVDVFLPPRPFDDEDEIDTVVQPDLFVVCDPQKIISKGCLGAPDLAVEILSPSTAARDMTMKTRIYESRGVREYWIVDPANKVLHRFVLGEGVFGEPVSYIYDEKKPVDMESSIFPGLSINVQNIFKQQTTGNT